MLNNILRWVYASSLIFLTLPSPAQESSKYLFPINPGRQNYLAGTMGELRYSHFHAGIDVKTGGVEGYPVHNIADGYVSRINVSGYGYGNALYITHPDGNTSVHAHLSRYHPELEKYIREQQYQQETFAVNLFPDKNKFAFKRGDVVAWSGNSGGSSGPHLHFEIRDSQQRPLNPLSFGFEEVKDRMPPVLQKMALVTLEKHARVNGQFGRFEFDLVSRGGKYFPAENITANGLIGVEILGYDLFDGVPNRNGIPEIRLYKNNEQLFFKNMDRFAFSDSRNILVHVNYDVKQQTGNRFEKLYVDDGNELKFYETGPKQGKVKLDSVGNHTLTVQLFDTYKNQTVLEIPVEVAPPPAIITSRSTPFSGPSGHTLYENILLVHSAMEPGADTVARFYANRQKYELRPAYIINKTAVYLWDMREGLPDSAELCPCRATAYFGYDYTIPPGSEFNLYQEHINIYFPPNALFDTLYLDTGLETSYSALGEVFRIHRDDVPLRNYLTVRLKPEKVYSPHEKFHVYEIDDRGNYSYAGGEWRNDMVRFRTRNFGSFALAADTTAPEVKPVQVNAGKASFIIRDDLSGIANFRAEINGEFVLLYYDPKRRLIWTEKKDETQPFSGKFVVTVTDNAGNKTEYTTEL